MDIKRYHDGNLAKLRVNGKVRNLFESVNENDDANDENTEAYKNIGSHPTARSSDIVSSDFFHCCKYCNCCRRREGRLRRARPRQWMEDGGGRRLPTACVANGPVRRAG